MHSDLKHAADQLRCLEAAYTQVLLVGDSQGSPARLNVFFVAPRPDNIFCVAERSKARERLKLYHADAERCSFLLLLVRHLLLVAMHLFLLASCYY